MIHLDRLTVLAVRCLLNDYNTSLSVIALLITLNIWTGFMRCPYCGVLDVGVLESRLAEDETSVRRRRECNRCHKRFTTYERVVGVDLTVVKSDGRKESFDREKLKKGLIKATWKRSVSMADIEKLIDEVERKLKTRSSTEFNSKEVGKLVLNRLRKLDLASYLAFASVYYNFKGIGDYKQIVDKVAEEEEELIIS